MGNEDRGAGARSGALPGIVGVADLLPDDDVTTVKVAGFTGLKNGELIRRATAAGFGVPLAADRNMPAQPNIRAGTIAVVLVPGNRRAEIVPRAADIQEAVRRAQPGAVTRVGRAR